MKGIIAFFDILGYQSFLENEFSIATAKKVLELIIGLPEIAKEEVRHRFRDQLPPLLNTTVNDVHDAMTYLIFSDTIVLSIAFPDNPANEWIKTAYNFMSVLSGRLHISMFNEGLPMRGAITEGEFLIKKQCFAGKPIIDAYKLCASLDFSGVVFHPDLVPTLRKIYSGWPLELLFMPYLSQLNNQREEKLWHINWVDSLSKEDLAVLRADFDGFIYRSFWMHGKDLPQSASRKVENTAKLARRMSLCIDEVKARFHI